MQTEEGVPEKKKAAKVEILGSCFEKLSIPGKLSFCLNVYYSDVDMFDYLKALLNVDTSYHADVKNDVIEIDLKKDNILIRGNASPLR